MFTLFFFFFFPIFFFPPVRAQIANCTSFPIALTYGGAPDAFIQQLFDWCIGDALCSSAYYQEDVQNITVFAYLARPIAIGQQDIESPWLNTLCTGDALQNLGNLWNLYLRARRNEQQACDINHQLVVDIAQLSASCVCEYDKLCDEIEDQNVKWWIALVLFAVLLLVIAGAEFYLIHLEHKKLIAHTKESSVKRTLRKATEKLM